MVWSTNLEIYVHEKKSGGGMEQEARSVILTDAICQRRKHHKWAKGAPTVTHGAYILTYNSGQQRW